MNTKPSIFIGSSREALPAARALGEALERDAEVTVWDENVFGPSNFAVESLIKLLRHIEYAIFIFQPDDIATSRGSASKVVRDNVIFELGLFLGQLGRERIAIVSTQRGGHIPSDLFGINILQMDLHRRDGNIVAAASVAANAIRRVLSTIEVGGAPGSTLAENDIPLEHLIFRMSKTQRKILKCIVRTSPSLVSLAENFPDISTTELYYRVEQIRLLSFVEKVRVSAADSDSEIYVATPAYLRSLDSATAPVDLNSRIGQV